MTIGEKILSLRKARGWSQEELAERVGVSRQAVSRWEADSAKPDADKIISVCDLFGISADYLLRDLADGETQRVEPVKLHGNRSKKPWFSWGMVAFGALTLFVLRILASVNRTYIEPVHHMSSDGTVHITASGYYTGFGYYLEDSGLEWLAWMALLSLLSGAGWLCRLSYQRRKGRNCSF